VKGVLACSLTNATKLATYVHNHQRSSEQVWATGGDRLGGFSNTKDRCSSNVSDSRLSGVPSFILVLPSSRRR
jgi:hypothetical protein